MSDAKISTLGSKPRMREINGIWSCISQNAWGAGWNAEAAYEDWKKKLALNIWRKAQDSMLPASSNAGRFG